MSEIKSSVDLSIAEIKDKIDELRKDTKESIKISSNMQFVIFDLAYQCENALDLSTDNVDLGRAYDLLTDIYSIAKEFGDYQVMRDSENIKKKILQIIDLISVI